MKPIQLVGTLHGKLVFGRRADVLARHVSEMLPANAGVLDVGCGDGSVARAVMDRRNDVHIQGIEVQPRAGTKIPVRAFDGKRIPMADSSVDVVMFIDVLHHTDDPAILLTEAARVARSAVLIKDHIASTRISHLTLRLMDWIGNRAHDVSLPYNYWSMPQWTAVWERLGLKPRAMRTSLQLYPFWARPVFEHGLHFMTELSLKARQDA